MKKSAKSVKEMGYDAGQRWIESDGAADCTAAEVRDYAANEASFYMGRDRAEYEAGFLAGVESMCLLPL